MHYFVITVQNQEASLPQRNYNSRLRSLICNWFQKEVAASMFKEPRNNYVIKLAYFLPRVVFLSPLLKCLFPGLDIIFIEENWTFPTTRYAARCNPKNGTILKLPIMPAPSPRNLLSSSYRLCSQQHLSVQLEQGSSQNIYDHPYQSANLS
jgi:hypothetical protein